MASRLESALDEFLRTRLGAERIDDLALTAPQRAAKKADYFAERRTVVIEQKLLTDTRATAVRRVVEEFRRAREGSVFGDAACPSDSACTQPRAHELQHRLFDAASRSVLRCARSANLQIRATARHFALARPLGVLVLLNERAGVLEPAVLAAAASDTFEARRRDGERELAHLDVVVVVTPAQTAHATENAQSATFVFVRARASEHAARAESFERNFRAAWNALAQRAPRVRATLDR